MFYYPTTIFSFQENYACAHKTLLWSVKLCRKIAKTNDPEKFRKLVFGHKSKK